MANPKLNASIQYADATLTRAISRPPMAGPSTAPTWKQQLVECGRGRQVVGADQLGNRGHSGGAVETGERGLQRDQHVDQPDMRSIERGVDGQAHAHRAQKYLRDE